MENLQATKIKCLIATATSNMRNYDFEWRKVARIIAVLDLAITFSCLGYFGWELRKLVPVLEHSEKDELEDDEDDTYEFPHNLAEILYVSLAYTVIELFSIAVFFTSLKLLKSTKKGRNKEQALRLVTSWRTLIIIFILLHIIFLTILHVHFKDEYLKFGALRKFNMYLCISTGLHLLFLLLILPFMRELGRESDTFDVPLTAVGGLDP